MSRRDALRAGAGASLVAALSASLAACGERANTADLAITDLGEDLILISGAGGAVVAAGTSDGVVLVDGGAPDRARDILAVVASRFGRERPRTVFNTHWHEDHTGVNEELGGEGARIIAHENTKLWMGARFSVPWRDHGHEPCPAAAMPNDTFYTAFDETIGGRRFTSAHMIQSHTDGDIYVHLPGENVIVAGGVVAAPDAYPVLDYATAGWIGGMLDGVLDILDLSDDATRIVPAHGPVLSKAEVQAQYDMLNVMLERIVLALREGMGAEDMLAAGITAEFDAARGDPTRFVTNAYHGVLRHLREVNGIVA